MKQCMAALLLVFCLLPAAKAAETAAPDPAALEQGLTEEQRALLPDVRADADWTESLLGVFCRTAEQGRSALLNAVRSIAHITVVLLLCAAARSFAAGAAKNAAAVTDLAGVLSCAGILLREFGGVLAVCRDTLAQIAVFSGVLQPVLATTLSLGGSAATATALQIAAMMGFDVVIRLVQGVLVPAACAFMAIAAIEAAMDQETLGGIAEGVRFLTTGTLKIILTVFIAYITVAGGVSGNVDRVALKTAKFAVSGAVPVVGGIISDAAESMLSGAALLKNTVGVFGMLCLVAVCIVPFLRAGACYLCYKLGAAVLSPLAGGRIGRLLGAVGTGFGLLLGMLGTCSAILFFELVYAVTAVRAI